VTVAVKECKTCARVWTVNNFYMTKGRDGTYHHRNHCKGCYLLRRTPKLTELDRSISYDYKFARFVGMGHSEAMSWIETGYKLPAGYLMHTRLKERSNWIPGDEA
jgi:hypothetical protein